MPATTANGWPYVLPTDNVADYPVTSQGLGTKLDAAVPFAYCTFTFTMSVGASASYDRVVTYPAGLFTLAAMVLVGKAGGVNTQKWHVAPILQTKDGCTVRALENSASTGGTAQTLTVYGLALQFSAAAVYTPGISLLDQVVDMSQEDDPAAMQALLDEMKSGESLMQQQN